MWTDTGSTLVNTCANAYGSGGCLKSGTGSGYSAAKTTISAKPASYSAATMPWDLADSFGTATLIPIPTIPASFYPGATPISALASAAATGSDTVVRIVEVSSATPSINSASLSSATPSGVYATSIKASASNNTTAPIQTLATSTYAAPSHASASAGYLFPSQASANGTHAAPTGTSCKLKRRHFKA